MSASETPRPENDLLVDCGNSQIKWAWLEGKRLGPIERIDHIKKGVPARLFKTWQKGPAPRRVVIANVCGDEIAEALGAWIREHWSIEAEFVVPRRRAYGVENAYPDPKRLGSDRWAALIAARRLSRQTPACIVDCGTALTIDALDAKGRHRGGLIVPGLRIMMNAVEEKTRNLPSPQRVTDETPTPPIDLLAADTQAALLGGAVYAMIATIDRIVGDVGQSLGRDTCLILTGGDAGHLRPLLAHDYREIPELVFEGLALIAGRR